jgi:Signal transduction histidine kinase
MSLRWRIALSMAAIAAFVSAFGATAAYFNTADQLRASIDESLLSQSREQSVTGRGGPGDHDGGGPNQSPDSPPCGSLQPASAAQVVSADGVVSVCFTGGTKLPVNTKIVAAVLKDSSPRLTTVAVRGANYRVVTVARSDHSVLQLGRSLEENNDILNSLQVRLLLFTVGGVLAAAALGWLLATRIVAPIERLRVSAENIARTGELDGEIPAAGTGEVGSLTTSFATMVGALAESRRRQQQLVADASHELRTPLTSLQTNAELLDRGGERLTDAQRHQVSEGIRFEVRELTDLVSELVDLARDPDTDTEPVDSIALDELTIGVVDAARRRTDREITTDLGDAIQLPGRAKALTRAISNLVDNAIKHGDGEIEVSVHRGTLEVRDHGRGIPEADLPNVFDRFYRADVARTEPGSGLGLAIVAQVVEQHHGTVFARNHPDGGAVVGFTLPAR